MGAALDKVTVPAAYVYPLVELVGQWNVRAERLLEGTGVSPLLVRIPATRVPLSAYNEIVRRAYALTGEDGLAFLMGLQTRASTHGFLGFAAMTASNIREAITLAVRFSATRTQAITLSFEEDDRQAFIGVQERAPLGDCAEFVVCGLMIGLAEIGRAITGQVLRGEAQVTFAEPPAYARFRHLVPGEVRFLQPAHRLAFDRALLDLPLVMADPLAARLAREQCERELAALGETERDAVVARVQTLLPRGDGGYHALEDIAARLHMSARTLKRQLAAQGTSFSDLLDRARQTRAVSLLSLAETSVEAVAAQLGYSDTANFTRAFKRWTGQTPSAFKRR